MIGCLFRKTKEKIATSLMDISIWAGVITFA